MMRRLLKLLALVALLHGGSVEAQGRPLRVRVQTELTFGTLLPGVATLVPPTDPLNAGEFEVRGRNRSEILIQFFLPADLQGPGGAAVLLTFGPGAAGYSPNLNINNQLAFDPAVPQVVALPNNGRAAVFLGGTASPPTNLPAGDYANTVTLQIAYLNN